MPKDYELDEVQLELVLEHCGQAGKGVCGIDEAGRGCLAGPVVAAAVILRGVAPVGLGDSKGLTAKKRDSLFAQLVESAHVGVGVVGPDVVDQVNILQANFQAMRLALKELASKVEFGDIGSVVVDGNYLTDGLQRDCAQLGATIFTMVSGDAKVAAISAASIIAKVTRDRIMKELDLVHPGYGFAKHAGYGSPAHLAALKKLGPCAAHRMTFSPVAAARRTEVSTC
jgi:ribonuclease HII